jgi:lipoate-protein ligase A
MSWEFLNTGFRTGIENMNLDEALANQLRAGPGRPTVRVFGWRPYAVSIGFNQRLEDFDQSALSAQGIDIVRRPTGGRAIFHAHELTYSVVLEAADRGAREIYRSISESLLCGLTLLGIDARLTDTDTDLARSARDPLSIPCFTSSAKSEIQFDGKKLIGSAQRRYGTVVLQHGSLLLGPQHRQIVNFLAPLNEHSRALIDDDLISRTIDAETILGRHVSFDEAAGCVKRGFELAWGIQFNERSAEAGQLHPEQQERSVPVV